jgi:hypothetical protein
MPTPVYQIGRVGTVYLAAETTYGTAPGSPPPTRSGT